MQGFFHRLREFGGVRLLREYVRLHVLGAAIRESWAVMRHKKTMKQADTALRKLTSPKLRKEFFPVMKSAEKRYEGMQLPHERPDIIWFCWLQGMASAPEIVKVCYQSLKANIENREIVLLTQENISDYVQFPDYIQEKFRKRRIPFAHYSDLLRLELLIRYGGTWIDSTVLCCNKDYAREILDSDFFLFQLRQRGHINMIGISNWFITSTTNNVMLLILRDMLYEYWKRYDCVVDYFVFHLFFMMIADYHQEEIDKMPKFNNRWPLMLSEMIADQYDEEQFSKISQHTSFHKLSYRLKEGVKREGTYYDVLVHQLNV